jgi:peptidoglycan/xylan/chitin deacetylase (PgdA/CDA1 family)
MLSTLVYSGLQIFGIPALRRRASQAAPILCYHNVVPDGFGGGDPGLHLPLSEFRWQMGWLGAHYQVVTLEALAGRIRNGRSVKGMAAVTFDDAYHGAVAHAWPLLRQLKMPATLFVPTRLIDGGRAFWWDHPLVATAMSEHYREVWLGELQGDATLIGSVLAETDPVLVPRAQRPADWAMIAQAASEGLDLGMHSATHRNLVTLDNDQLAHDLAEGRRTLATRCGVDARLFAYPYGHHDARVRAAVGLCGTAAAVTLDFGLNDASSDLLALHRVNIPASISRPAFASWTAGLRAPRAA